MAIDVVRAREETPGCESRIHLNNAGASLMPSTVRDSVVGHLELEARIGGYEAAEQERERIEGVYESAARLIGCRPDEIALVENATRGWDAIFYSLPFRPRERILTGVAEYGSNYIAYLQAAQRWGVEVTVVPNDEDGQISIEELERLVDERTRLISLSHVPTSGGLVNPAAEVGRVAREAGVLFLLDACQSVGQLPVDVGEIGCHFLSTTGRKFLRGPRGSGFLYVSRDVVDQIEPAVLDVRSAEWVERDRYVVRSGARRFETWEVSYALQLGLGAAIDYALGWGLDGIWERDRSLGARLRDRLSAIPGAAVHDLGSVRCGIVTFSVAGIDADVLRTALARDGINVWISRPNDTRLDFEARGLDAIVRASVHYFNTEEEVERACVAVERVATNR